MDTNWQDQLDSCEELVPVIGKLLRTKKVALNIYGASLSGLSSSEILKAHRYARHVTAEELDASKSLSLAKVISGLEVHNSDIDIARLLEGLGHAFTSEQVKAAIGILKEPHTVSKDVVLYGFGRIGRLVARIFTVSIGAIKWIGSSRSCGSQRLRKRSS